MLRTNKYKMRDLLNILDQLNEASVANYPMGTQYLISDGAKGQTLNATLQQNGIVTAEPMASVGPEEYDPDDVVATIGNGRSEQAFRDADGQIWVLKGSTQGLFVHAGKLANRGEIAEGILGAAMFAKFTKRQPGEEIGIVGTDDIAGVLSQLKNVGTDLYQVEVQDSNNQHADLVTFRLVLKTKPYQDLMNPENQEALRAEYSSAAAYVNSERADRYSKYFYLNGRADHIGIIADGAASETESKVDVWVAIMDKNGNTKRLKLNASLKAGPVKQFGQVGGSESGSMLKLWDYFGVDVTPWLKKYEKTRGTDQFEALSYMYKNVANELTKGLKRAGPKQEAEFVSHVADAVTFFATLGDTNVELVQFDKGGFKILRFHNLVEKLKVVDLTATFSDSKARPEITIHDIHNPKNILITIRCKVETKDNGDLYVRNIIEKGKLLEELTKVQTTAWDEKQTAARAAAIGTAHSVSADQIGKPKSKIGTKPMDLGRERR